MSVSARMNAAKRTTTGAELFIRAQPSSKSSAELISYTLDNFVPTEGQSRKMKEALKRRKGSELLDKKKMRKRQLQVKLIRGFEKNEMKKAAGK